MHIYSEPKSRIARARKSSVIYLFDEDLIHTVRWEDLDDLVQQYENIPPPEYPFGWQLNTLNMKKPLALDNESQFKFYKFVSRGSNRTIDVATSSQSMLHLVAIKQELDSNPLPVTVTSTKLVPATDRKSSYYKDGADLNRLFAFYLALDITPSSTVD